MRIIDITSEKAVELWSGRRLYLPDDEMLVTLPKGCVYRAAPKSLSFGNATKTTVVINGTAEQCTAIFRGIIDAEVPQDVVRVTSE